MSNWPSYKEIQNMPKTPSSSVIRASDEIEESPRLDSGWGTRHLLFQTFITYNLGENYLRQTKNIPLSFGCL